MFELRGVVFGVPFEKIESVVSWSGSDKNSRRSYYSDGRKYKIVNARKLFYGKRGWEDLKELILFKMSPVAIPIEKSLNLIDVDGAVILPIPHYLFESGMCFFRGLFLWKGNCCLLLNDRIME